MRSSTTRACGSSASRPAASAIVRGRHAARFAGGSAGVLQGTRTFVLQDEDGNIELTHSISAGLDYAAVGPEHAWLRRHRPGRVRVRHRCRGAGGVPDAGAARRHSAGARIVARDRLCAASSRRAAGARVGILLVNLSGRGDKDVTRSSSASCRQRSETRREPHRRHVRRLRAAGRAGW